MRRIPDVLDCWFESGSMPYAQCHYPFENKERFEKHFPADFINEGLDQTRGWFYSLCVIAAGLFQKPPFLHCIVSGIVLAEDGKKMSKSLHNYTDPMEIVEKYGADALRFALLDSSVVKAEDLKFGEENVKDVIKFLMLPLWNAYSFFVTYANIDGYTPGETDFASLTNPLDKWIVSELNKLVEDVSAAYEAYDVQSVCQLLLSFIDELNNWYIRRSRRRFWKSEGDSDKKMAYDSLYKVLMTFIKLACPIIPFMTEEMYQNLKGEGMKESVHLNDWPVADEDGRDLKLEEEMALVMKAVTMGRSLRASSQLKVRQPLRRYFIVDRDEEARRILEANSDIIKEELNVKEVDIEADESRLVSYSAKANFKVLGSKLGKSMKEVAGIIQAFTSSEIAAILDGSTKSVAYSAGTIEVGEGDIIVARSEMANVKVLNEGGLTVGFDTEITQDLLYEGLARDAVRAVQTRRKDVGLEVSDHITLTIDAKGQLADAIEANRAYIMGETLSDELTIAANDGEAVEIADESVALKVVKA